MKLSKQQDAIVEVIRLLRCVKLPQLFQVMRCLEGFESLPQHQFISMMSQLRYLHNDIQLRDKLVSWGKPNPPPQLFEAIDVMILLSANGGLRLLPPEVSRTLVRFSQTSDNKIHLFTVVEYEPNLLLTWTPPSHDRVLFLVSEGTTPQTPAPSYTHFFATRQSDGQFRFFTSCVE